MGRLTRSWFGSSGNGTRVLAHQGHIPSAWATPAGCRSGSAAPSGGGAPAPCPVPLPRRSWHGPHAALPRTPGDLDRALVVPPLRVRGERLRSLAASARVLLSGIGALILTRPCGPGGWQARLAVAWCAWSSGGHRVLRVAQGGSAAAGVAELPRPAPAVQQPTGEVGALRNNRPRGPRGQALDRRRPPGRLS